MIDLHLHSHYSDGTWSPSALVEHALSIGMKHIALTDHDTTDGIDEALERGGNKLQVIAAIEINTIYHEQKADGQVQAHDVHILGYFINKENEALKSVIRRQSSARQKQVERIIERVNQNGTALTLGDVAACAGKGAIGKAHLSEAIVRCGAESDIMGAYKNYLTRTGAYYIERESVSPFEAVAAIREAGGIASLAHPGKGAHVMPLLSLLIDGGLEGVEAYHRVHSLKLLKKYVRFAHDNDLLVTGGSDCHGPYKEYASMMGAISLPRDLLSLLERRHASR